MTDGSSPAAVGGTISHLEAFFEDFRRLTVVPAVVAVDPTTLATFFAEAGIVVERAEASWRANDRVRAGRFNVLGWIDPGENKLSDLLADLLNPCGRHGQGDAFLRAFLARLGLPAAGSTTVTREAPTHGIDRYRRRIDVLIDCGVLVAIENKIDAAEQYEQVRDYLDHLQAVAGNRATALVYLTPNGRPPAGLPPAERDALRTAGRLHCWSYAADVREWLEDCWNACEANKVRYFLGDFIDYIQTALVREPHE